MSDDSYHHGSHLPVRDPFAAEIQAVVMVGLAFAIACMIGIATLI